MKKNLLKKISLIFTFCCLIIIPTACSSENIEEDENEDEDEEIEAVLPEGLEIFDADKIYDGYILVNNPGADRVYIMDKDVSIIHEWNLKGKKLGNDVHLMSNGKLLAMLESETPSILIGGYGGLIAILDRDGNIDWSYEYSSEDYISHHDALMLPNGNILFMTWERKSMQEAVAAGYSLESEVIYDGVKEIDPQTNEIVWEWHMWDHLVQDFDDTKANYGNVNDNFNKIDINYAANPNTPEDISHANGIDYDPETDLIYLSANFYNEIWVIDHSTTSEQASTSSGGNFGVGGDLVYRFGNPKTYDNPNGKVRFDRNHHPNLLDGNKKGNILVYVNGNSIEQSTAYELKLPEQLAILKNADNEPEVIWSFTDENLYSGKVSGVDLLPNGNRLITEGDFGFWEVTNDGEVVWRYTTSGFFWRAYHYDKDDEAIINLGL
ncbi:aryl-sulfate sulfotransferase [Flavobacteriaceae bacterium GF1]